VTHETKLLFNGHTPKVSHTLGEESISSCSQRVSSAIQLYKHLEVKGSSMGERLLSTLHHKRNMAFPREGGVHAGTLRISPGLSWVQANGAIEYGTGAKNTRLRICSVSFTEGNK
jgi:hypothetical protein